MWDPRLPLSYVRQEQTLHLVVGGGDADADVVDQPEEALLGDVRVSEEEALLLLEHELVKILDLLAEVLFVVTSGQANREQLVASCVGRQLGERLFS